MNTFTTTTTTTPPLRGKVALLPSRKAAQSSAKAHNKPAWGLAPPPPPPASHNDDDSGSSKPGAHTDTAPRATPTPAVMAETQAPVNPATATASTANTPAAAPTAQPTTQPPPPFAVDGGEGVDGDSAAAAAVGSFDDMGLSEQLLRGVYGMGFERPSPIQARAIVPLARGHSVLVQAPAGTGKTAAFAVGVLQRVDPRLRAVQALLLAPTRELAQQTAEVAAALSRHMGIGCALCIGGTAVGEATRALRAGPAVVVGTPGRLRDLLERGALSLQALRAVVLDEADDMLSRGFAEQVDAIFERVPPAAALAVVSATFPPDVLAMVDRLAGGPETATGAGMKAAAPAAATPTGAPTAASTAAPAAALTAAPTAARRPGLVRITLAEEALDPKTVRQFFVECEARQKLGVLLDLTCAAPIASMIVFANTRATSERLATALEKESFSVALLHADMEPAARSEAVARFRRGDCRVLVATNVIARGLDVQHVSLVVNYEMAHSSETYLHRIGRCGRRGRQGLAITLLSDPGEHAALQATAARFGGTIAELPSNFAQLLR